MLVGADGIWSAIRGQMYNEGQGRAPSKDGGVTKQGCTYSGCVRACDRRRGGKKSSHDATCVGAASLCSIG